MHPFFDAKYECRFSNDRKISYTEHASVCIAICSKVFCKLMSISVCLYTCLCMYIDIQTHACTYGGHIFCAWMYRFIISIVMF